MERMNNEYIALLSAPGSASEKFWCLEKRLREDKNSVGVVAHMSRSYMERNIMNLLSDGVITLDDLNGFSEDLREKMALIAKSGI